MEIKQTDKILEIVSKAMIQTWNTSIDPDGDIDLMYIPDEFAIMFSKLIAKECAQVALSNSHRDDDMGAIIARQITTLFGVN